MKSQISNLNPDEENSLVSAENMAPKIANSECRDDVPRANPTNFEADEIESKSVEMSGGRASKLARDGESDAFKSLSESITRQTVADTVQQVDACVSAGAANSGPPRKKRPYNRKLDEHGNPVKRAKKSKTEEGEAKKARRKYVKKAEKWFKDKRFEGFRDSGASPVAQRESLQPRVQRGDVADPAGAGKMFGNFSKSRTRIPKKNFN